MGGGLINQQQTAARFTRQVLQDAWAVAADAAQGATHITVVLAGTNTVPNVGTNRANYYAGATVLFTSGSNIGFETTVSNAGVSTGGGASTTLYLDDALPDAATAGDTFVIYMDGGAIARTGLRYKAMQTNANATGIGTGLQTFGLASAAVDLTISATATVTWKGLTPSGNYVAVPAVKMDTGVISTTATASGTYMLNVANLTALYADITSYSSGTVSATGQAGALPLSLPQVGLVGSLAPYPSKTITLINSGNEQVVAAGATYKSGNLPIAGYHNIGADGTLTGTSLDYEAYLYGFGNLNQFAMGSANTGASSSQTGFALTIANNAAPNGQVWVTNSSGTNSLTITSLEIVCD